MLHADGLGVWQVVYEVETVLVASIAEPAAGAEQSGASKDPARASIPSGGVNGALMSFGDFVLKRHGKARARGDHKKETEFIGYSTTAYYFYNLCGERRGRRATQLPNGAAALRELLPGAPSLAT